MEIQQTFEEVCEFNGLTREQAAYYLLLIAEAFLKKNFTPALDKLQNVALRRGAYLVDFYTSFYPIDEARKKQFQKQLDTLRQQLTPPNSRPPFYPGDMPGFDEVADFWGLSNGMRPAKVPGLLDLQRRVNL